MDYIGYDFKNIHVIPSKAEFIDLVLARTQSKIPIVLKGYPISAILKMCIRKLNFIKQTISDKTQQILNDFPILGEIHSFYAELIHILYDKSNYKLALGKINDAKRSIEYIARESIRLIKHCDNLYRCKMLESLALERVINILNNLTVSLTYLKDVRQHMVSLPSIDPNTRTLLVCGYPNVGKSSFVNKITSANVDVEPYAFTTKSLEVGHTNYKYDSWQVIDTPAIINRPIEERTILELQSITALNHLKCTVIFLVDISEQNTYTIDEQVSILPLFKNKPLVVVLNKVDLRPVSSLSEEERQIIQKNLDTHISYNVVEMSLLTEVGIDNVKEIACEKLMDYLQK